MVAMHSLTSDNHPSTLPAILNDGSHRTVRAAVVVVVEDILEGDNIFQCEVWFELNYEK